MHRNKKKLPSNVLPQCTLKDLKAFLSNYTEQNTIELPGKIPGYKIDHIKLLSSSESKANVWRIYTGSCECTIKNQLGTQNLTLWNELFPNVVAKRMTDLCSMCQQNTAKLQRSLHIQDEEKPASAKLQQEHI